mmetsp:Transcript_6155/g.6924  ORF Transcript_6155/g.6924 Transcript_6155/m.6924 type:complete len:143 (+) Transcript_6155:241-669(+)
MVNFTLKFSLLFCLVANLHLIAEAKKGSSGKSGGRSSRGRATGGTMNGSGDGSGGDSGNTGLWILVAILGLVLVGVVIFFLRRYKQRKEKEERMKQVKREAGLELESDPNPKGKVEDNSELLNEECAPHRLGTFGEPGRNRV